LKWPSNRQFWREESIAGREYASSSSEKAGDSRLRKGASNADPAVGNKKARVRIVASRSDKMGKRRFIRKASAGEMAQSKNTMNGRADWKKRENEAGGGAGA